MVFTREKNDTSNQNLERCYFTFAGSRYEHAQVSLLAGYPTINNCDSKLYPGCLMLIVDKGKPNKYILYTY